MVKLGLFILGFLMLSDHVCAADIQQETEEKEIQSGEAILGVNATSRRKKRSPVTEEGGEDGYGIFETIYPLKKILEPSRTVSKNINPWCNKTRNNVDVTNSSFIPVLPANNSAKVTSAKEGEMGDEAVSGGNQTNIRKKRNSEIERDGADEQETFETFYPLKRFLKPSKVVSKSKGKASFTVSKENGYPESGKMNSETIYPVAQPPKITKQDEGEASFTVSKENEYPESDGVNSEAYGTINPVTQPSKITKQVKLVKMLRHGLMRLFLQPLLISTMPLLCEVLYTYALYLNVNAQTCSEI